jgi:hypothetical protein
LDTTLQKKQSSPIVVRFGWITVFDFPRDQEWQKTIQTKDTQPTKLADLEPHRCLAAGILRTVH